MGASTNGFRDEECVVLSHYDKREGKWIETVFPKVGGRLRLAHEDNEKLSITSEVVQYDQSVAVVRVNVNTRKGDFSGIGMASLERDQRIAPAILELAETRAIARALRFAGYGVEFCSAEEITHLENESSAGAPVNEPAPESTPKSKPGSRSNGSIGGNGRNGGSENRTDNTPNSSTGGNGKDPSGRLTNKQLGYIVNLGKRLGLSSKDLDPRAVSTFGVRMAHLSVKQASEFIEYLHGLRQAA